VVTFPISDGSRILLALCWLFSMRHFSATAINCSLVLAALVVVSMLFLMLSSNLDWILCFLMESLRWRSSIRDWYWKLLNCSILSMNVAWARAVIGLFLSISTFSFSALKLSKRRAWWMVRSLDPTSFFCGSGLIRRLVRYKKMLEYLRKISLPIMVIIEERFVVRGSNSEWGMF